mgnify:CR=1 FL=1
MPCVFLPSMRNVLVIHSFCESAQVDIGSNSIDICLTDFDKEIIDIEVNTRDSVLKLAQIMYLLFSNKSFSISRKVYLLLILLINDRLILLSYPLKILASSPTLFLNNSNDKCLHYSSIKNLILFFKKV